MTYWNWSHAIAVAAASSVFWSFVAHAVNTFPVPNNIYGRWLLGLVQWWIGQRDRALNTFSNQDTVTVPKPKSPLG